MLFPELGYQQTTTKKAKKMGKYRNLSYMRTNVYPNPKKICRKSWTQLDIDWWNVFYKMIFG